MMIIFWKIHTHAHENSVDKRHEKEKFRNKNKNAAVVKTEVKTETTKVLVYFPAIPICLLWWLSYYWLCSFCTFFSGYAVQVSQTRAFLICCCLIACSSFTLKSKVGKGSNWLYIVSYLFLGILHFFERKIERKETPRPSWQTKREEAEQTKL